MIIRLAPLTITRRWTEWTVSEAAVHQIQAAVDSLVRPDAQHDEPRPFARGLAVGARGSRVQEWTPGASKHVSRRAIGVADAGGVLGVRLGFDLHDASGYVNYQRTLTAAAIRDLGGDFFQRRDPERHTRRLVARLEALGHSVTLQPAAA